MVFHTVTIMVLMILTIFIISPCDDDPHRQYQSLGVHSLNRAKCIPIPRMFVGKI